MKSYLLKQFPFLLEMKALMVAFVHTIRKSASTYAQAGEDRIIEEYFIQKNITTGIYFDIGANHPTRISNTYNLYRKGWSGVTVEPNRYLCWLHRRFRPRDIQLSVGCADELGILEFTHSKSHVLSGFQNDKMKKSEVKKSEWVPVITLDVLYEKLKQPVVHLLSIDVEGFDLNVAKGGAKILKHTQLVCIEGSQEDHELMKFFKDHDFSLLSSTVHNLFFKNDRL